MMRSLAVAAIVLTLSAGGFMTARAQSTATPRQNQTAPRSTAPSAGPTTAPSTTAATGQFSTESAAKSHCPSDNVVWANTQSKIYHYSGTKDYGKTKQGAYMCQQESDRSGFRAAKNEKAPAKS
jgi:hypothetical protein